MKLIFFLSSNLRFCCCSSALVSKLFLPSPASQSNCSGRAFVPVHRLPGSTVTPSLGRSRAVK